MLRARVLTVSMPSGVVADFTLLAAEGHVPVPRARHDHLADKEEVVQLGEGEVVAGAAGDHDRRAHLAAQQIGMVPADVAHAVQECHRLRRGRAEIDRRTDEARRRADP